MEFLNEYATMLIIGFAVVGGVLTLTIIIGLIWAIRSMGRASRNQAVANYRAQGMSAEVASTQVATQQKAHSMKALLGLIPIFVIAIGGIVFWQYKTSQYRGPITEEERAMLLTEEDLTAFGMPQLPGSGEMRKDFGSNGLPSLYYSHGSSVSGPGYVECRITRAANLRGVSSSYYRPGHAAGDASQILTLGGRPPAAGTFACPTGTRGNTCWVQPRLDPRGARLRGSTNGLRSTTVTGPPFQGQATSSAASLARRTSAAFLPRTIDQVMQPATPARS